eukprot:4667874-Prymnesium_polylepis.1
MGARARPPRGTPASPRARLAAPAPLRPTVRPPASLALTRPPAAWARRATGRVRCASAGCERHGAVQPPHRVCGRPRVEPLRGGRPRQLRMGCAHVRLPQGSWSAGGGAARTCATLFCACRSAVIWFSFGPSLAAR